MSTPQVVPLLDEGLGNTTYVVDLGAGRAMVVDASVDLRSVRAAATRGGLQIAYAADTHLHADFVSGARQLATAEGVTVLASAAGDRQFGHVRLVDGQEVDLGGLRLTALVTPGHTTEHVAFLLSDGQRPVGVFTGGSLIVGAAARTDLVDPDRTVELARAQYHSLQRLMALPDDVAVWPTHGAGSFCSAPPGGERTSTIGRERSANSLLQVADENEFVKLLLGSLGSFPAYFLRLPEINRLGPRLLDGPPGLPVLTISKVQALLQSGAQVVDARAAAEYAAGHLPGSVSIPLRAVFGTWLGWVVSPDRPVVVMRGPEQDPAEIAWQGAKVGYENLVGELDGGMASWVAAGLPVRTTSQLAPGDVLEAPGLPVRAGLQDPAGSGDRLTVLDVRQLSEFDAGHLPGAEHVELGQLAGRAPEWRNRPVVVMCAHGERAMTGASLLERAGAGNVGVMAGGPQDWADFHGVPLELRR